MRCPACGADNREGRKFCGACGSPLAVLCPDCGASNEQGERFCGECGRPLEVGAAPLPSPDSAPSPAAERRFVTVLFADLVGFTSLSEARDAEDARELLTRYFDTCRRLIELYGGTVEKFIGDAVMAVWGTPVANEDDAERAVRAAIDLVEAVPELDPSLEARAGVLTGEAAVTLGAQGQGMVAGDLVNTASRIQSTAESGAVLVGESTRRATEAAIAYEDAGSHALKGKAEPVRAWRAIRVLAGRKGALKQTGLEPPFVGRDRELRLAKELYHGSAEERRAHLVSVVGIAGIGKSRLAWEFFKYVDGVLDLLWWHRGRCLAYGEGVTYWALAEMVRMRAQIAEGEEPAAAREKLSASVAEHVTDPEERAWIEPRLAHLLGIEDGVSRDRDDLFAAWRLFFERLADAHPVVLVFEDMQWADVSMLEFVEYLLEWSRSHPIFVLTLARPELAERHPSWGAGKRNFTALTLEPLSPAAMEELLDGFVPGLPVQLRSQILARAEGVPLYAVETVRMLLDRGLLEQVGNEYRPTGPIDALEVPETLHALIAARLDGLAPEERRLLQDASVVGKTFTKTALSNLSAIEGEDLEPLLASLVRKEVLSIQADPRSPERGQYGFLQDLLRRVAYETLAKAERKARHLAAAAYLESNWGPAEQEIAEVVSSHYLEAYEAAPDAEDALEIRGKAQAMLTRAGERAASLAASEEAARYFERAAGLAVEPSAQAPLWERAGATAWAAGHGERAQAGLRRAIELFDAEGESHAAARVSARLAEVEWAFGHLDDALERLETAYRTLAADEPDEDLAVLAAQLARMYFLKGDLDRAAERVEVALQIGEALWLPEVLSQALNTKAIVAGHGGRLEEFLALVERALKIALEHELPTAALRAYNNLADGLCRRDRLGEALECHERALALARRVGDRFWEWSTLSEQTYPMLLAGLWDEAIESYAGLSIEDAADASVPSLVSSLTEIAARRGDLSFGDELLERWSRLATSDDFQEVACHVIGRSMLLAARGEHADGLAAALEVLEAAKLLGPMHQLVKAGYVEALEAALALGDLERVEDLLGRIDALRPGELSPFLRAHAARFLARLASARGEPDAVEGGFKAAAGIFREFGMPFWLAVVHLEHGEWLVVQGRVDEAEPLLAEARETFQRLGARSWLERLATIGLAEALVE